MAKTKIFYDFESFLNRPDKSVNGVSPDFAKNYPDWERQNETNMECWNCKDCVGCWDCISCKNCNYCNDCVSCWGCNYCNDCVNCKNYNYCN